MNLAQTGLRLYFCHYYGDFVSLWYCLRDFFEFVPSFSLLFNSSNYCVHQNDTFRSFFATFSIVIVASTLVCQTDSRGYSKAYQEIWSCYSWQLDSENQESCWANSKSWSLNTDQEQDPRFVSFASQSRSRGSQSIAAHPWSWLFCQWRLKRTFLSSYLWTWLGVVQSKTSWPQRLGSSRLAFGRCSFQKDLQRGFTPWIEFSTEEAASRNCYRVLSWPSKHRSYRRRSPQNIEQLLHIAFALNPLEKFLPS